MQFSKAIVRTPCGRYADGITTAGLGRPDVGRALAQHQAYVEAVRACGVEVTVLPADERYPDSTFVEDTAVVTAEWAVIARPGAESRAGEVESMRPVLAGRFERLATIEAPGTLDGGDICETRERFLIGVSERTNEAGAAALRDFLASRGRASTRIDVRGAPGLLHLKSGLAEVAPGTVVVVEALAGHPALREYKQIVTAPEEAHAANCLRLNEHVLVAAGSPRLARALEGEGLSVIPLDMSEFRKMDGGLSCLSLRY